MKTCSVCNASKSLGDFHRDRSRADGRQRSCKACAAVKAVIRRRSNLAAHAANQREWRKTNPQAIRAIQSRYQDDPIRQAARRAVHEQIRLGNLTRPADCERCGGVGKIHAHHDDYARPLDVRFLCEPCHLEAHGKTIRMINPAAVSS